MQPVPGSSMTWSLWFSEDDAYRFVMASGDVTIPGVKQMFRDITEHPKFRANGQGTLFDLSAIDRIDFGFLETFRLIAWTQREIPAEIGPFPGRVILAPNEFVYGMVRMYQQLALTITGDRWKICRTRSEAAAALLMEDEQVYLNMGWEPEGAGQSALKG